MFLFQGLNPFRFWAKINSLKFVIMAMEATHVRFARDISQYLNITDWSTFYAGAIYPDSRYVTGISRDKTHGPDCPKNPFAVGLSDFEKGWAAHLYYDEVAHLLYFKALSKPHERVFPGSDLWQTITAVKVIEDMLGFKYLGSEKKFLLEFSADDFPITEDKKLIEKYCSFQKNLYDHQPEVNDYKKFWTAFNIEKEIAEGVLLKVHKFLIDKLICDRIENIFSTVLKSVQK